MNDVLRRALATTVEAGLAVLLASGVSDELANVDVWQRAGLAALAGLLTFVYRTVQTYTAPAR